jgi:hypothetical protein
MRKLGLVIIVGLVVVFGYFVIFGFRTTGVGSLKRVTSQNIQLGATPETVIRFLQAEHLEPSQLFRPELMSMHGHVYSGQSIVIGMKRNSARALLWSERIYLVFMFDENHNLVKYDVFPVYMSL